MALVRNGDHHSLLSKLATNDSHGENSPYFDGWKAYDKNPYHPTTNPQGVIQMGLAENMLCSDLIEDWIARNPKCSICTVEGISKFKDIAIFQDYHGLSAYRSAVAKFMGKVRGGRVKFDPDRIVMSGGATGANELITFCLADPGDAFLIPSPYYAAFDRDVKWRTGVQLVPFVCESSNGFKITRFALEDAFEKAQNANINVKGLIIVNPSNPLGTILDRETLRSLVSFINEKNIHLVCDEIFAGTVFKQPNFISISEIVENDTNCNLDLVHVVCSLSKDLGLPGFRVGVVYSYNDAVVSCGRKMSSFGLVSTQTQYLIASMLSDEEFIEKFIAESGRRLAERQKVFKQELSQVRISCLNSNAGLFVWMDLRSLLNDASFQGETALWRTIINEVKLNVSPGSSFHCPEPGWFRVCFANMDEETMRVALKRIRAFVSKAKKGVKSKRSKASLQLTLCSRIRSEDATVKSPHYVMSPHSPCIMSPHYVMSPHSPLVHATT